MWCSDRVEYLLERATEALERIAAALESHAEASIVSAFGERPPETWDAAKDLEYAAKRAGTEERDE